MFLRVALFFLSQCIAGIALCQPAPAELRDGQQVTITGKLTLEPAGRLQFVTIKTPSPSRPIFRDENRKEVQGEPLNEIGLSRYSYPLLYAHRGQEVTVTGKMSVDEASPYFWHGTRLEVASLRTADGIDLAGNAPKQDTASENPASYQAEAILHADLALPWTYRMLGHPKPERSYFSCGSNGGGDVVNCFCADGFRAVRAEQLKNGKSTHGSIFADMHMAQFEVGDDASEVHLHVTCSH